MRGLRILLLSIGCGFAFMAAAASPKVLVYMFDGARGDIFEAIDAPAWKMLKENRWAEGYRSAWSVCAEIEPYSETSSAPNHTTIATGKLVKNHRVANNKLFSQFDMEATPTWLERIARRFPEKRTLFAFSWRPDLVLMPRTGRCFVLCGTDVGNNLALAEILRRAAAPDALLVFDDCLDGGGHNGGFYPFTPGYLKAGRESMARLEKLLATIKARPSFADEDWLIVLCSDHGGIRKSHGLSGGQCSTVPLLYCGRSVPAGVIPGRPGNLDIAAQVLRHFGLADEVAQLDGRAELAASPAPPKRPVAEELLYDLAVRDGKVVNTAADAAKYGVTVRGEPVIGDGFFSTAKGGYLVLDGLRGFEGNAFTFALTLKCDLAKVKGDPAIFSNKNWVNGFNPGFALVARPGGIGFNTACKKDAPTDFIVTKPGRMDLSSVLFGADEKTLIAISIDPAGNLTVFQRSGTSGYANWFAVGAASVIPHSKLDWIIGQDGTGKYKNSAAIEVSGFRFWNRALTLDELRELKF